MFTKREWIEEYKKFQNTFKLDERNMVQSHLSEDYHANKIFSGLCNDVDQEKKFVDDAIGKIKLSVNDIYAYLKGYQKGKNLEIRQKIMKIEDMINKNRMDFKNRFENLLIQEQELEDELVEFENSLEFAIGISEIKVEENENGENKIKEIEKLNEKPNKHPDKNNIEIYIEYIFSNAYNNNIFEEYSENKIEKMVNKINDLTYIKDKTYLIEIMIDKNLNGYNLGWQPRDHQDFLKLRSAYNNKINTYEFLSELENTLPFLPKSELKNHIKEYNKFIRLIELKKLLIGRYKEIKIEHDNQEKQKLLENIEKQKQNQKNIKINKFMKGNNLSGSQAAKAIEMEQEERQKKLERWRLQKELKKRELEDEKYREEMEGKEKEKIFYEERKKNLEPQLEEYRNYKNCMKIEQEYIKQNAMNDNKIEINDIDLQRIKEKSNNLLEKKMSLVKSKSLQKFQIAQKYAKFKIKKIKELEKVESKLTTQTENYANKQRKKHDYVNNKIADTMGGNVLGRMSRAIPTWRKGLFS